MNIKNLIIPIMVVLIVILSGVLVYGLINNGYSTNRGSDSGGPVVTDPNDVVPPDYIDPDEVPEEDKVRLGRVYVGDNLWTYSVKATFPNPCYEGKVSAVVAESFPEQVTVYFDRISPAEDEVCPQVLQEFVFEGELNASEEATFKTVMMIDGEVIGGSQ